MHRGKAAQVSKKFVLTRAFLFQTRRLIDMWRLDQGNNATPAAMIGALQKMPGTQDIIAQIRLSIPDSESSKAPSNWEIFKKRALEVTP